MSDAFARVPALAAQHLLLAMAALALALAVGVPVAIRAARAPRLAAWVLGAASLVQTIPSLALLALFYPALLWLSALVGGGVPALGFLPALLALTLYALLPIVRNIVTGLRGLDAAVLEAADGIGMTGAQKLRLVELPLVLPVAMAGIRTAAVWTIGAATLSTTVGQPSLGDLIFAGLQTQAWTLVIAGCVGAAGLALGVDALLGMAERDAGRRRWARVWLALGTLAAVTVVASAPMWPGIGDDRRVVVGAKNFSEQYILARLIGARLERAGYSVRYRDGLGSAVAFGAVAGGEVDVYVDYAGTIWTAEMHRTDTPPRGEQLRAIADWVRTSRGVGMIGALGFENAYVFAMRGVDAKARGIATLDDLAGVAPALRFGADLEFLDRPEWQAVRRAYPLRFAAATPYSPTFMYRALESGRADVISAFSSDGRIAADKLAVLDDVKGAIPGYDAIMLVSPAHRDDPRFAAALRPLIGRIPVTAMREANYLVDRDRDKRTPEAAARWLAARIAR
ncbi:ABC transporter permease [Sphingomonas sp. Leaf231]|uniref:ABC transporter permease/substrate-binding protein n=1 Tax=Sphingomonas sp. Leaf231 TaxID=1736301 RepID=UPI0006FF65D2|nr:ABC transporter permease/substrate-binding protein [Sphingomonas sp. Leaf231]KQN92556.1 ABC transporter permease [Sphingomonas sp. Leaf231]